MTVVELMNRSPDLAVRIRALAPRAFSIAVVLVVPFLTLALYPLKLNQNGKIDPWIYFGYIHDFTDTTSRFGMTYYGDRIAYIFADKVFVELFGNVHGYFAFRYAALVVAASAAYAIANRFYGAANGALAAAWICLLPWLPRSIFWTHYDGVGAIYLTTGMAFLLVPSRRRLTGHVLAGAAYALAVNCNFLLAAVGITMLPGWLFINRKERLGWIGSAALALVLGFCVAYVGLGILMHFAARGRIPFFFDVTAIHFSIWMLQGGAANWFLPLHTLLLTPGFYYLLVPPTLLFSVGVLVLSSRQFWFSSCVETIPALPVFAALHLGFLIVLALVLHWLFAVAWLGLFFYTIYFLPACLLVLIALFGESTILLRSRGMRIIPSTSTGFIVALLLAPLIWPQIAQAISIRPAWTWLLLALGCIAAAGFATVSALADVLLLVLPVALSMVFYTSPQYLGLLIPQPNQTQLEWDAYNAALFFQRYVNDNIPIDIPVRFWYRSGAATPTWLDSVQSTFLSKFTRVASFDAKDPGMPVINAAFHKNVSGAGALVLLGESAAELDAAESALVAAHVPFKEASRSSFVGKRVALHVAILFPTTMAQGRSLPIDTAVRAFSSASLERSISGITFRSAPQPWSYIGRMPLLAGCLEGGGWMAVDIRVTHGTVGVGVLNRKGDGFVASGSVGGAGRTRTILLWLDSFAAAGDFVLRNWEESSPSEGILEAVRIAAETGHTTDCGSTQTRNDVFPADAIEVGGVFGPAVLPGTATKLQGAGQIDTPPRPWAYAAQFPLQRPDLKGPLWVRVRANVHGAPVGIGILNKSGNDFVARMSVDPGDSTVTLPVAKPESMGDLVVQSWAQGAPAKVTIESIIVLALPSSVTSRPAEPAKQPSSGPPADAEEIHDAFGPAVLPGTATKLQGAGQIDTPPRPWAYAAQFTLQRPDLKGPLWVRVRANVRGAPVGIGILNKSGNDFVARMSVDPGDSTVTLPVAKPESMGDLVVQSWAQGAPAKVTIESIVVLALPSSVTSRPAEPAKQPSSGPPADAEEIHDAFGPPVLPGSKSKLRDAFPVEIATPTQPWAYAAEFPLRDPTLTGPLWLRVQLNVKAGPIGIGVLNGAGNDFLARSPVPTAAAATITLTVTKPEQIGDLVVQSWDNGKPGDVIVDSITVMRRRSPPTAHQ